MNDNIDSKKIRDFWENRARTVEKEVEVTHRDIWQRWLEIEFLKLFMNKKANVIDIGCGNGYTTKILAPLVNKIVGIDYSQEMIMRAKQKAPDIDFFVADVLELDVSKFSIFDMAISVRCLINLKNWNEQKKAILNIISLLKKDGVFIFIEGSKNGRDRLNELRKSVGLDPMPIVWHNCDFYEEELLSFLEKYFIIEKKIHFGVYDFLSRIFHPLLVAPDEPKYDSKINEIAAALTLHRQDFSEISRTIFLVLKKK